MIIDIVKVFIPALLSFFVGIILTPFLTEYLYSRKMWKKKAGKKALDGADTPIFNKLHETKEVGTPKMGGIIIWFSALVVTMLLWVLAKAFPNLVTSKIDFLSRNQTWIPLVTLLIEGLVGLVDDILD